MLKTLNDFEAFFSGNVSQIATLFEIIEGIEGHGFI